MPARLQRDLSSDEESDFSKRQDEVNTMPEEVCRLRPLLHISVRPDHFLTLPFFPEQAATMSVGGVITAFANDGTGASKRSIVDLL